MSTHTCALCNTTTARYYFSTVMSADVLGHGMPRKGDEVVLCELCSSANGMLMGKEYNWRKYGDERPSTEDAGRKGCPNCTVDCTICPYAEEG